MGTPDETCWPGVSQLPDFKPSFPKWSGSSFEEMFPRLDSDGLNLLMVCFYLYLTKKVIVCTKLILKFDLNRNLCCTIQTRGYLLDKPYTIATFQDFNCPILNSLSKQQSNSPTILRLCSHKFIFHSQPFILTFRAAFYYLSSTVSKRLRKWPYSVKRTVNSNPGK